MFKRRRGADAKAHVKHGLRVIGDDKFLFEKLGRNDPCPYGSGRRSQALLHAPESVFDGMRRNDYHRD